MTDHHREVELVGIINGSSYMRRARDSAIPLEGIRLQMRVHVLVNCPRSIPRGDMEGRTHMSLSISTAPAPKTKCGRQCLVRADKWMAGKQFCVSKSCEHFRGLSKASGFRTHPGDRGSSLACLVSTPMPNDSSKTRTRVAKNGMTSLTQGRNNKSLWGRVSGP